MAENIETTHRGYRVMGYRGPHSNACAAAIKGDRAVIIICAETDDLTPAAMIDRVILAIDAVLFPVYYPGGEEM